MQKTIKIKNFILTRIFGIILLSLFFLTSLSLGTRSSIDPYYGKLSSLDEINNLLGFIGSYFAGTVYVIFSYAAYIIPLFFFISGIKKIFGIKTNFLVFHIVSFLFGLSLVCFLLKFFKFNSGIIGILLFDFYQINLKYLFNNNFLSMVLVVVVILLSFIFLVYGLTIRLKTIKLLFKLIYKFFYFFLKIFKITYLFSTFKSFLLIKNKIKKTYEKKFINKNYFKKEPTFQNYNNKAKYKKNDNNFNQLKNDHYNYMLPPLSLLKFTQEQKLNLKEVEIINQKIAKKLEEVLKEYGVIGKINNFKTGPVITLFEFVPEAGIKTNKVVSLAEDIARSMSSKSARISSQPEKSTFGIEIPNKNRQTVYLGDLLRNQQFNQNNNGLVLALGKTVSGDEKYADLEQMPHLLIAGTTGSGKSVGINSMILSLLFKFKPSQCKLILIDPKMLELSIYENIPHLLTPVVTDPKKAVFALKWVVNEMENRYRLMNSASVKNIKSFNDKIAKYLLNGKKLFREVQTGIDQETKIPIIEKKEIPLEEMPLIVVVIDEMADLMMVSGKEVEHLLQRLAQMARASGIHLIAATQRPSVDVITGTIKANFPSRISFRVASRFDSRTILNEMGAEQLLGNGDMLFLENAAHLMRLHGGYISEAEIEKVVQFIRAQSTEETKLNITNDSIQNNHSSLSFDNYTKNIDELYPQAVSIVIKQQKASTSFIQRYLQIGYNRAARMIEKMEEEGIITEANHVGKRNVLKKTIN